MERGRSKVADPQKKGGSYLGVSPHNAKLKVYRELLKIFPSRSIDSLKTKYGRKVIEVEEVFNAEAVRVSSMKETDVRMLRSLSNSRIIRRGYGRILGELLERLPGAARRGQKN